MIRKRKTIDSRMATVIAALIIEDNLPIHMDIGLSSKGSTDILLSYEPEHEAVYLDLINSILEPIFVL